MQDLDGELHKNPIIGKYLEKFYPAMWEMIESTKQSFVYSSDKKWFEQAEQN